MKLKILIPRVEVELELDAENLSEILKILKKSKVETEMQQPEIRLG